MLQPIENSSQTWLVTRHQYGLISSFLTTQTSSCGGNRKLHRETSAVTAQAKRKERFLWLHYVTLICSRWSSRRVPSKARMALLPHFILGDPGADSGGKGKSKRAGKYGTKESKERREEPQGTMSYHTSSKRSPVASSKRSVVPYFPARLDFPSPPLSALGSPRMSPL